MSFKKNIVIFFTAIFLSTSVLARPVTVPGFTIGLPLGKPFPTGWYLVESPGYIAIPRATNPSVNVFFNDTALFFVSPKEIAKGRLEFYADLVEAYSKTTDKPSWSGNLYNPDLFAGLAWDLGNDFYFSNFIGTYFPMNTPGFANNSFVFNERAALTYSSKVDEATIHFIYGTPAPSQTPFKPDLPNYINIDMTYTHLFGKLQLGPIAYGSWDTNLSAPWSQFAVGGLVGYDFTLFALQGWIGRDTNANPFSNRLSGFIRLLIPLDKKNDNLSETLDI